MWVVLVPPPLGTWASVRRDGRRELYASLARRKRAVIRLYRPERPQDPSRGQLVDEPGVRLGPVGRSDELPGHLHTPRQLADDILTER